MMSATEISANEKNWRTHPDKQSRALSGLLEEIGIAGALLCYYSERNGGALTLIDGHLRKEVAPGEEWPVLITDLTDAEADTLLAVYAPVAAMAGAERERLAALIEGVRVQDARLRELVAGVAKENGVADPTKAQDAEPQIDRAEELRVKWGVETGQLWELGDHRLLCGDSTKADDVARVMGGEKAGAVVTDPVYGTNQPGVPNDEPEKLNDIILGSVSHLPCDNAVAVFFQSPRTFPVLLDIARKYGWKFERMLWIYKTAQCVSPWRGWLLTSEAILVFSIGKAEWVDFHPYAHDCYQLSEVSGELQENSGWHGSVKPIKVVRDIISRVGGIVYDAFLGSGTTIIACENLGRKCRAIEISPGYVAVALQRWTDATGKTPVLLSKE